MEDNQDDIFNLDEDFNEIEISQNTNNNSTLEKNNNKEKEEKERNKEDKNIKENLISEEKVETKDSSGKKEPKENENDTNDKDQKENQNDTNEKEKEINNNANLEDSDSNEENFENAINDEKEEEKDIENEDSEGESQEKEDELKIDFKERHKNMQKWAIEDNLDISDFSNKIKDPPITFPFELDEFQKRSILRLENHQNVLVCAHTSSGKTVVAEYGIALGKKNSKRVLYTSPIKALSNQKFREFKKKFEDVGILTGDVSINPEAQCIIMTTEILQNSLYKNSELLNQVEWVIFDEIHYINDNERGHVWEEILILLPKGIGIIMLSATVPNYMEFAQWVGDIKETNVYVQNTLRRIVPLQHLLFIDENNVFKVKEKDEIFDSKIEQAFNYFLYNKKKYQTYRKDKNLKDKEYEFIDNIKYFEKYHKKDKNKKENWRKKDNKYKNEGNNPKITKMHYKIEEIVDYLDKNDKCPAVIFVFSIKKINEYAKMLSLKNLVSKHKKNEIIKFYKNVVNSMPKEDQEIPQVKELGEILLSGIGMHHSGLLPILKETIEILYSRGLIKILFATTSFSIGLNMPTRTVVFTDIYKYNDTSKEILTSSEYLQMCGRAGRRGIDKIGNIYILLSELTNKNEKEEVKSMLRGKGDEVVSKFRICYRTLLSFFSRNIKDMNEFFRESFLESNMTQKIPQKIEEIEYYKAQQKKYGKFECAHELVYAESKKDKNNSNNLINENYINNDKNVDNKNYNNDNINDINIINNINNKKEETFEIEKYPVAEYAKCLKKYKELSYEIFTHEKIYDKLSKIPGRILKVRKEIYKKKSKKGKEIDEGIYVMLIEAYKEKEYFGSLWCLGFNGFIEKNKRNTYKEDICVKKGIFGNIKFFYKVYSPEDVIEAYEYPFQIKLKGKKNNSFWRKDKNDYYYIIDRKVFKEALKELSRLNNYKNTKITAIKQNISFATMNFKEIVKDLDFHKKVDERQKMLEDSKKNKCLTCPNFYEHLNQYHNFEEASNKINKLMGELNPENLEHYKEFKTRQDILKDLKYVNEDNTLALKGKAAREIGTTDCVLITELLTSDILTSLSDGCVVGFISGFASNKNEIELNDPGISKEFSSAVKKFNDIYEKIESLEKSYQFEENKYNRRMTFEFSEAMKNWIEGKEFLEILNLTELEEGKLYNLIMRIFLMLEEISNFYSMLGNVEQSKRYLEIKVKLMRGIMGIQSLYLQDKIDIDSIGVQKK